MREIRQTFWLAGQNFSGWKRNPRIVITFLLAFVLCLLLSEEVMTQAHRYETALQILEPFIWTYGDAASVMLSSLLLVVLFGDMPFVNQETPYRLIRTKRNVWLAGQVIYVTVVTVLYNLFLVVVLAAFAAPFAFGGNVWSKTAAMLGYGGAAKGVVPVSVKTMENTLPYECALQVFLLMLCYSLFIVSVMLCLNLVLGNAAGIIGAFAMNLYGFLMSPKIFQKLFHLTENQLYQANVLCGWLSPLNHATFPMHNFGYDYLPRVEISIGIFIMMIAVLIVVSGTKVRTYNFTFIQMDE
ncbi:hypothetical protein [Mediterraneibacter agrestimuris]|uniref:hypothetical protein n=1 Tax=Mediterraneibacter agrestimuris TaxID=2941333 RepID=UPI002041E7F9|nr:hypothetical protein [Mediterraneibacter agrestimuris]